MYIKTFNIKNFKSFQDVTIHFNSDLNILTGKNNCGKTTVLEAISLWHECFNRLIHQAKRTENNYRRGQWMLGPTYNKYFSFDEINSVRSPHFDDMFYRRVRKNKIKLGATFVKEDEAELEIAFTIGASGLNYVIGLENYPTFNFDIFNSFFSNFPLPIGLYYASPVSAIQQVEEFVTDPKIKDALLKRQSATVIRNRLCKLIHSNDANLFTEFKNHLSNILYNNEKRIELESRTDAGKDTRAVVNFKIGASDVSKDIALLGSGALQCIEILLNIYQPEDLQYDFNMVLMDEPDSHIHRDIQSRLIHSLTPFSSRSQLFVSTHNESFIRSAAYRHLFHLEGEAISQVQSIDQQEVITTHPHFSGIYPSQLNPIIKAIGSDTGLDFINAIEADQLLFVEGSDDARVLDILLSKTGQPRKKYMFWVLGGISEVFKNISSYQKVFPHIKNGISLWEKSFLIFDKDYLTDHHRDAVIQQFNHRLGLHAHIWQSYTMESTLLTEIDKTAALLSLWLQEAKEIEVEASDLNTMLCSEYTNYRTFLEQRFTDAFVERTCYHYRDAREKLKVVFENNVINYNDIQLATLVRDYWNSCILEGTYYKLMDKKDVGIVMDKVVQNYGTNFSIETDFIDLVKQVNDSLWLEEWNFLKSL